MASAGSEQKAVNHHFTCRRQSEAQPGLDGVNAFGWKRGDPARELFDMPAQLGVGQRARHPAVSLGEVRVEIVSTEHYLERATATHEPR